MAHPGLGDWARTFDLDKRLKLSVQLDRRQPKTGHLDFLQDEDSGAWSVRATPNTFHGPENANLTDLFNDRDTSLSSSTLAALRRGVLPLVRSLDASRNEAGYEVFTFEFATEVEISQILGWSNIDTGSRSGPTLSAFSDIAGTSLIAPVVTYQNQNQRRGATMTLVASAVRRLVVTSNVLAQGSSGQSAPPSSPTSGSGGSTDVTEPASALLILPGLLLLAAYRHQRSRTRDTAI